MCRFFTYLLFSILSSTFLFATDIKQISDEPKPQYRIDVVQGEETLGSIIFESFPDVAPKHCHNLDSLVGIKFYDGTAFHRVIPNFMIQGGDPNSKDKPKSTWGFGDPSQTTVPAEFSTLKHVRGILSAARTNDPNSATSQFFICVVSYPSLDGKYSIYGQVISGMEVADKIVKVPRDGNDNPNVKVEMMITKLEPSNVNGKLFNSGNIRISPNPANEYIKFINENSDILINKVEIVDINGKNYFNHNYPSNTSLSEINIPVHGFPTGIYIVNIFDNSGQLFNLRFVVN